MVSIVILGAGFGSQGSGAKSGLKGEMFPEGWPMQPDPSPFPYGVGRRLGKAPLALASAGPAPVLRRRGLWRRPPGNEIADEAQRKLGLLEEGGPDLAADSAGPGVAVAEAGDALHRRRRSRV